MLSKVIINVNKENKTKKKLITVDFPGLKKFLNGSYHVKFGDGPMTYGYTVRRIQSSGVGRTCEKL